MSDRIENLIAKISPGVALRRAKQRRALAYEAAIAGRLRGFATQKSAPNDYTEVRDRIDIIRQARDLHDNFGLFASIIRKVSIYALGRVRYRAHTGNAEINTAIDSYIKERSSNCDISGRFSLAEIARMSLSETLTAGDVFCLFRNTEGGTLPQLIEADRVGGDLPLPTQPGKVGGVTYDQDTGQILEYEVVDRTPAGGYINKRPVPADMMVHVTDPERYDRYRGISPFAPVLNDMRDLKEVMAACLIGVKLNEYHAGFVTGGNGMPTDPGNYFSESSDKYGSGEPMTETKLTPGIMQHLPEGYTAELVKSERPSGQFQSYLELLIRIISNALCLPYGFVYSLSGLGGPAARMDAAQAQRVIEYWQTVISDRLLQPIASRWILDGVASGDLEVKTGAKIFEGVWQFAPRITIDVGRESDAGINEIRAGLRSRADWWDEEGKDADQEMEIIRDEALTVISHAKELSEKTGLPIERCLDMLDMRTPNGMPSIASTPPTPPVNSIDEENDKPKGWEEETEVKSDPPNQNLSAPESPDSIRLRQVMSAPQIGLSDDSEYALVSALDATKRLSATPEEETAEDWLSRQTTIKHN